MPWRRDTRPYYVLVSEIMLQQTQVSRVIGKFNEFVEHFPDVQSLSSAPLSDVLRLWSGLGYNRRAKYLHEAAQVIVHKHAGQIPDNLEGLVSLPGIGKNTAGALLVYSFNQPVTFIETNIRTVYFHHFFEDNATVSDKELQTLVANTIDKENPREFYWALMDYGAQLKSQGLGRLDQSKHYKKQSPLEGSVRQVRGDIVKLLLTGDQSITRLKQQLPADNRFEQALSGLQRDGIIRLDGRKVRFVSR